MITLNCQTLCDGVINNTCNFQVLAITKDEMKALLEAHLKQEHKEELEQLDDEEFNVINQRIESKFTN